MQQREVPPYVGLTVFENNIIYEDNVLVSIRTLDRPFGISWEFKDRFTLSAMAEAWVRHFDVYEARTADNFWTGELRLDTEIEASIEAAVRVHTTKGKHRKHDLFISLLGAHVTRNSNMKREISLATNFDITRVFLGFVVRGH